MERKAREELRDFDRRAREEERSTNEQYLMMAFFVVFNVFVIVLTALRHK